MDRPKRKCTTTGNDDESNSASTSKKHRRQTNGSSSDIADDGSKISTTKPTGEINKILSPIEKLPTEILSKIIEFIPMIQWIDLERVDPKFRDAVFAAWGSLKKLDIQRDLLPRQRVDTDGAAKFRKRRIGIVKELVERAPNLIDIAVGCSKIETVGCVRLIMAQLVRFKKLQWIDFGEDCSTASILSDFLRESASRDQLKDIGKIAASMSRTTSFDQNDHFSIAFDNSNNNEKSLRLETMDFESRISSSQAMFPWEFLAAVDVSRLTTFRVINTNVPQRLLADFLHRSSQLRRLSFDFDCNCNPLYQSAAAVAAIETVFESNNRIISAVARMDELESLTMGSTNFRRTDVPCGNCSHQLMGLLITLGQRQSFKELGLIGWLTKPTFMNYIAPAIPTVESLRLESESFATAILDVIFLSQSNLRKLHVCAYEFPGGGSFNVINHVVSQNAPTLESLILDFPYRMFPREQVEALGGLNHLRELELTSRKDNINDAVLKSWTDGFGGNMTKLEIKNCGSSITGDALVELIEKSPSLKTLNMGNYPITDGTLEKMAALSPKLEEFGFDRTMVTQIGFQHVTDGFGHLKKLNLKRGPSNEGLNLDSGKYRVINLVDKV